MSWLPKFLRQPVHMRQVGPVVVGTERIFFHTVLCEPGMWRERITDDANAVTCKKCIEAMAQKTEEALQDLRARGSDLDAIAAQLGLVRHLASPGVVEESDASLRARALKMIGTP